MSMSANGAAVDEVIAFARFPAGVNMTLTLPPGGTKRNLLSRLHEHDIYVHVIDTDNGESNQMIIRCRRRDRREVGDILSDWWDEHERKSESRKRGFWR